jgi:hypothetical protein
MGGAEMLNWLKLIRNLVLAILVVGGFATNGQAEKHKHYWRGATVGMFMEIPRQRFSYVAGFTDSAIFAFHYGDAPTFKWLVECMADHPNTTNPVEVTKAIVRKLNTVLKDHPKVLKQPVGLLIWAELEVRCGQVK